jgi:hypothetical protein
MNTIAIVSTDVNAHVGTRHDGSEDVFFAANLLGPFGNPANDKQGEMFYQDFMIPMQMCCPTSFKEKKSIKEFDTWMNAATELSHQIDYILILK